MESVYKVFNTKKVCNTYFETQKQNEVNSALSNHLLECSWCAAAP